MGKDWHSWMKDWRQLKIWKLNKEIEFVKKSQTEIKLEMKTISGQKKKCSEEILTNRLTYNYIL